MPMVAFARECRDHADEWHDEEEELERFIRLEGGNQHMKQNRPKASQQKTNDADERARGPLELGDGHDRVDVDLVAKCAGRPSAG